VLDEELLVGEELPLTDEGLLLGVGGDKSGVGAELRDVLGDGARLGEVKVTVLEDGKGTKGVLGEEVLSLPVRLHREGLVEVELDIGEGGGSEHTADSGVAGETDKLGCHF